MKIAKQKIKIPEALENLAESCGEDALKRMSKLVKAAQAFPTPSEQKYQRKILRAISDPTRLNILRLLRLREMCVCELMAALDMPQPLISHHLRILKDSGILDDRKEGKWIFYELHNRNVLKIIDTLDDLAKEER